MNLVGHIITLPFSTEPSKLHKNFDVPTRAGVGKWWSTGAIERAVRTSRGWALYPAAIGAKPLPNHLVMRRRGKWDVVTALAQANRLVPPTPDGIIEAGGTYVLRRDLLRGLRLGPWETIDGLECRLVVAPDLTTYCAEHGAKPIGAYIYPRVFHDGRNPPHWIVALGEGGPIIAKGGALLDVHVPSMKHDVDTFLKRRGVAIWEGTGWTERKMVKP